MTPITQMRLTEDDKKRIVFIKKQSGLKTTTEVVQWGLKLYEDVLRKQGAQNQEQAKKKKGA